MADAAHPKVKIKGAEVEKEKINSVIIDRDMDQPDMCQIGVRNLGSPLPACSYNLGDAVDILISFTGQTETSVFQGEIVGIEPTYDTSGRSNVLLRCFNRLHRLTRGRKSRTFENMTDAQIAQKIAQEAQLTPKVDSKVAIQYKHVYQHNQTDLEFLLYRASRIDYEVAVTGEKDFLFQPRKNDQDSGITLKMGKQDTANAIQRYTARLSSSVQVTEVQVRGWDPAKRKEIIGKAKSATKSMGKTAGSKDGADVFGSTVQYEVDDKVTSQEEADRRAQTILDQLMMNYITGECICIGNINIKPGLLVTMDLGSDDRFGGKHYVAAVSHRYTMNDGSGKGGGFTSAIRFKRNSGGK